MRVDSEIEQHTSLMEDVFEVGLAWGSFMKKAEVMFWRESLVLNLQRGCMCLKYCGCFMLIGLTINVQEPPPVLAPSFHNITSCMLSSFFEWVAEPAT